MRSALLEVIVPSLGSYPTIFAGQTVLRSEISLEREAAAAAAATSFISLTVERRSRGNRAVLAQFMFKMVEVMVLLLRPMQ